MLLAIALVAFVSLGLPDGVLGVAWPSIRRSFGLPPAQLGALLASAMAGYLASSFSSGAVVARLGVGRVLFWSSALMVVNSLAYALAPVWGVMVAASVLAGLGAGAIDAGINAFAAARFSPRLVSWLHASYGVGAMLGPLLMAGVLTSGLGWRWGYAIIGLVLAAMAASFLLTVRLWDLARPEPGSPDDVRGPAARLMDTLARPRVWVNVALFFVYTGLEVSAGQWSYSLFTEARGVAPGVAGIWVAVYWAGLTAGRIVSGAIVSRVPGDALLRLGTIGSVFGTFLIWWDPGMSSGFLGLAVLGFALAPIFPTLIAQTPTRLGPSHATSAIGFQVAGAYLGTAAIPGLTGVLAGHAGLAVIGPCLFGPAVVLFLLQESSRLRRPIDETDALTAAGRARPAT
ncbi:MAG TPA: MFS transporter [Methylomirabilota bacterium]|nr:MFS transporter [Methylomirabilota bacterium]